MLEGSGAGAIVCTSAMLARSPEPFLIATGATRAGQLNLKITIKRICAKEYSCKRCFDRFGRSWRFESGEDRMVSPARPFSKDWFIELAKSRHIPLGRLGTPTEAANAILFFASPMASYITGETIEVTGGQARNV